MFFFSVLHSPHLTPEKVRGTRKSSICLLYHSHFFVKKNKTKLDFGIIEFKVSLSVFAYTRAVLNKLVTKPKLKAGH